MEGYRPGRGRQPGFDLVDGPLKRLAERALENPSNALPAVIDEINRGNLAKVFGELYFLLEYRDEDVTLQYSAERVPPAANLLVIGTMNTADRSIALSTRRSAGASTSSPSSRTSRRSRPAAALAGEPQTRAELGRRCR